MLAETAYAKINLALHVRARRADGYHDIETIFAFADFGDELTGQPAAADALTISGPFGGGLPTDSSNLVLRALATIRGVAAAVGKSVPPLAVHLVKNLPVAAGIGGGSADAAAVVRMVNAGFALGLDEGALIAATAPLGADIGACIISRTRRGSGLGWELAPLAGDDGAGTPLLLVNPGVPLATGPVFAGWDGLDRGPLATGDGRDVLAAARAGRNDLEAPARALCPVIDDVLAVLRAQLPILARMSGSGATCFALFADGAACAAAHHRIAADHPDWWTASGRLR